MRPIRETAGTRAASWLAAAALGGVLHLAFEAWLRPDSAMIDWLLGSMLCG